MFANEDDQMLHTELESVIRAFHLTRSDIQIHQINETLKEPEQSGMGWEQQNAPLTNMHPPNLNNEFSRIRDLNDPTTQS